MNTKKLMIISLLILIIFIGSANATNDTALDTANEHVKISNDADDTISSDENIGAISSPSEDNQHWGGGRKLF